MADVESEDDAVAAAVRHSGRAPVEAALRSSFAPRARADGTVRMSVVLSGTGAMTNAFGRSGLTAMINPTRREPRP
jgi:hypothetical protein